ncbi:hypothetical protein DIPPA_29513 [Diplonema papillatum]|nr:hypothetical protein DIPPA_29513 [Diplonema papillatum]
MPSKTTPDRSRKVGHSTSPESEELPRGTRPESRSGRDLANRERALRGAPDLGPGGGDSRPGSAASVRKAGRSTSPPQEQSARQKGSSGSHASDGREQSPARKPPRGGAEPRHESESSQRPDSREASLRKAPNSREQSLRKAPQGGAEARSEREQPPWKTPDKALQRRAEARHEREPLQRPDSREASLRKAPDSREQSLHKAPRGGAEARNEREQSQRPGSREQSLRKTDSHQHSDSREESLRRRPPPIAETRRDGSGGRRASLASSRGSPGVPRARRKKKTSEIDSEKLIVALHEGVSNKPDDLFDHLRDATTLRVVAALFALSRTLTLSLVHTLFRVTSKRPITDTTVQHLQRTYDINIPEQYSGGRSIPAVVIAECLSENIEVLESFLRDAFRLTGILLKNNVVPRPDFEVFCAKYKLSEVMAEVLNTRALSTEELQERNRLELAEAQDPDHPKLFYHSVIVLHTHAAKVQRSWRVRKAKKEMRQRALMLKQGLLFASNDPSMDKNLQREIASTTGLQWKRGKMRRVHPADAHGGVLRWLNPQNVYKVFSESCYLLPTVVARILAVDDPRDHLQARHVVWLQRAYRVDVPSNTTLLMACTMFTKLNVQCLLDDALKLADVSWANGGLTSDGFIDFLEHFDMEEVLRTELADLQLIPKDGSLKTGISYFLAECAREMFNREQIASTEQHARFELQQRVATFLWQHTRALHAKHRRKASRAGSCDYQRPLTDFSSNHELLLYGDPAVFEQVLFCQNCVRSFLCRLRFRRLVFAARAAVTIQKNWKRLIQRKKYLAAYAIHCATRAAAATRIQAIWRQKLCVTAFAVARRSLLVLQKAGRGAKGRLDTLLVKHATRHIRKVALAYAGRAAAAAKRMARLEKRLKIIWRTALATRAVMHVRIRRAAARVLQGAISGNRDRSSLRKRKACERLTRIADGFRARMQLRNAHRCQGASGACQRAWRCVRARRELMRRRRLWHVACVVQSHARAKLALITARARDVRLQAAVALQAAARSWLSARAAFVLRHRGFKAEVIQRAFRCHAARGTTAKRRGEAAAKRRCAAHLIRVGKAYRARRGLGVLYGYTSSRALINRLLDVGKGFASRAALHKSRVASKLQRAGRGFLGRSPLCALSAHTRAAIAVQTRGRGAAARAWVAGQHAAIRSAHQRIGGVASRGNATSSATALFPAGLPGAAFAAPGMLPDVWAEIFEQAALGRRVLERACRVLQKAGRRSSAMPPLRREYVRRTHAAAALQRLGRASLSRRAAGAAAARGALARAAGLVKAGLAAAGVLARLRAAQGLHRRLRGRRGGAWRVQRVGRGGRERERIRCWLGAGCRLQRMGRGLVDRAAIQRAKLMRTAAECVQRGFKCFRARVNVGLIRREKRSVTTLQRAGRGRAGRWNLKREQASLTVQRAWRCYNSQMELVTRRELLRRSQQVARVFRSYQSRLHLAVLRPSSARLLQRGFRGLSDRVQLRLLLDARNKRTLTHLLSQTASRQRATAFHDLRVFAERQQRSRKKRAVNVNVSKRLLALTDVRLVRRYYAHLGDALIFRTRALVLQRVSRAYAIRAVLGTNRAIAASREAVLVSAVKAWFDRRRLAALQLTTTSIVTLAAALLYVSARRVLVAAGLQTKNQRILQAEAFECLAARRQEARRRRRQVIRLLKNVEAAHLASRYDSLQQFTRRRHEGLQKAAQLYRRTCAAHSRLLWARLSAWHGGRRAVRAATRRLLAVAGCVWHTAAAAKRRSATAARLLAICGRVAAVAAAGAIEARRARDDRARGEEAAREARRIGLRRSAQLLHYTAKAHLRARYERWYAYMWAAANRRRVCATNATLKKARLHDAEQTGRWRLQQDERADLTLVDDLRRAGLRRACAAVCVRRLAEMETRESKGRVGVKMKEDILRHEIAGAAEAALRGSQPAEPAGGMPTLKNALSARRALQAWDAASPAPLPASPQFLPSLPQAPRVQHTRLPSASTPPSNPLRSFCPSPDTSSASPDLPATRAKRCHTTVLP